MTASRWIFAGFPSGSSTEDSDDHFEHRLAALSAVLATLQPGQFLVLNGRGNGDQASTGAEEP